MAEATANANFQSLNGDVHDTDDPRYREYRRRWIENPTNQIVEAFPIHLDIEATNRCNLRCTFCDKLPYLSPDEFGDIDWNLFRRIIDEGKEHRLCSVKFSYRGEPLLHSRLPDMVAYAQKAGILDIYFNTNAMLLTERKIHELLDAGLNRISISMEGTEPEPFEKERLGAKFDVIVRNIDRLLDMRARRGITYPKVRIQTVAFPGLDLATYTRYWKNHADEVAAVDYKAAETRQTGLECSDWACPQLWQRMTIEWDGTIIPCNNDDYRHLSPGNVHDLSIADAWLHPKVASARRLHQNGRSHQVKACNGCPWRTTQIEKHRRRTDSPQP